MHCDRLFFAFTQDLPCEIFPQDTGLIIADAYGAPALRSARASPAGGHTQIDDGAFRDGGCASDQPADDPQGHTEF